MFMIMYIAYHEHPASFRFEKKQEQCSTLHIMNILLLFVLKRSRTKRSRSNADDMHLKRSRSNADDMHLKRSRSNADDMHLKRSRSNADDMLVMNALVLYIACQTTRSRVTADNLSLSLEYCPCDLFLSGNHTAKGV
jgi:hypothetical protein